MYVAATAMPSNLDMRASHPSWVSLVFPPAIVCGEWLALIGQFFWTSCFGSSFGEEILFVYEHFTVRVHKLAAL
jgi:hypothetical protein